MNKGEFYKFFYMKEEMDFPPGFDFSNTSPEMIEQLLNGDNDFVSRRNKDFVDIKNLKHIYQITLPDYFYSKF